MNPGPAPQPPDRPRLNLTPNPNLPGSMANMAISPIRSTATSTYTGSTISLPIARQQTNNMDGMGGVAVRKEGWASIKENRNPFQPWKNKFLILRKEAIDFHKAEGGKVAYSLLLKDVVNVGRVEAAGTIFEIKRRADGQSTSPGDDDGQNNKALHIKVKMEDDLYEWIDFIYGACPGLGGVSNPTNFAHAVHVGFDPQTGEFVGLPPEWSKLLNSSAITKEDYERNPQAVFEVLDFYTTDLAKKADDQFGGMPPAAMQNKPMGMGGGASVAPPRPPPPGSSSSQYSPGGQRRPEQPQQRQQMQNSSPTYTSAADAAREEQRRRQREAEDRERREMEEYNASLPKTKLPMAQQEIGGGYGGSSGVPSAADRFNPSRAAPPAPKAGQQINGLKAQRPAPAPPTAGSGRPPVNPQSISSSARAPGASRNESPSSRAPNGGQAAAQQRQPQTQQQQQQAARLPAPVKPLNVSKVNQNQAPSEPKPAEPAPPKQTPAERKQDVRMSTMSENEVMAKLKEAVSKEDPNLSYSKQKKIGQGASGSVYVAKIKDTAVGVARDFLRQQGPRAQVAIKQMDLAHQPRKELIVNEIMVMKDNRHKNIVNFLDAFLRNNNAELWVVMEFMEGGALTDVIDNNPSISEEQISTICHEVCQHHYLFCHVKRH